MGVGIRQQPEKYLDRLFRPKASRRSSRKWKKQTQNRRDRHEANRDPEAEPHPKYLGYEW
jgi:hypothetical protein